MKLDLHCHSTASDGEYTPTELVCKAKEKGLEIFSLTDHDSISGLDEAYQAAMKQNERFVPGIEISAQDFEEIHILGYNIDYKDPFLAAACEEFRKDRDRRGERICDYLKTHNMIIDMGEIKEIAGESIVGRPHFAKYMLDKGYISDRREAFDKYLDTPEFFEATKRKHPSLEESISFIKKSGGLAVLAHPGFINMSFEDLDKMTARLKAAGLDGIECFYSQHSDDQKKKFFELAQKYDLKISCGSDFHGESVKPNISLGMDFDERKYGKDFIVSI